MMLRSLAPAGLVAALAWAFAVASPLSAQAADDEVSVTVRPASATVEFGSPWGFDVDVVNYECASEPCDDTLDVTIKGESFAMSAVVPISPGGSAYVSNFLNDEVLVIPAGSYEIDIEAAFAESSPSDTVSLDVSPAQVVVGLDISSDETQPHGAIVSAQLTGNFADAIRDCFGYRTCHEPFPAGTWTIEIVNADGEVVVNKSIMAGSGDSQFASFYWSDVPPAQTFRARAQFAPSQASPRNFVIEPAQDVVFDSPKAIEPGDTGSQEVAPVTEIDPSQFTLPAWVIGLTAIVTVGLIVAIFIVGLRLRPQTDDSETPLDSDDDDDASGVDESLESNKT